MPRIYNKTEYRSLRRHLRKNLSPPEVALWRLLQRKQIDGYKFRRQYGIGRFVVDFYCPRARLAIEVDGNSHFNPPAMKQDVVRQTWIESFGIRFLRFRNDEVLKNPDWVVGVIGEELHRPPLSPPQSRRGEHKT